MTNIKDQAIRYGNFVEFGDFRSTPSGHCWVNLDQVRRYSYLDDGRVKVCWANGDEEVLTVVKRIAPENYFVVPAAPGFELLTYYAPEDGETFPMHRTPVIAWRIDEGQTGGDHRTDESLTAISMNGMSSEEISNVRHAVRSPDGRVTHYKDGKEWESVEKWLEWAEEDLREYVKRDNQQLEQMRERMKEKANA